MVSIHCELWRKLGLEVRGSSSKLRLISSVTEYTGRYIIVKRRLIREYRISTNNSVLRGWNIWL